MKKVVDWRKVHKKHRKLRIAIGIYQEPNNDCYKITRSCKDCPFTNNQLCPVESGKTKVLIERYLRKYYTDEEMLEVLL